MISLRSIGWRSTGRKPARGMTGQTRSATQRHAKDRTRSHDAVMRVYDEAGNVIETHEHKGEFKGP